MRLAAEGKIPLDDAGAAPLPLRRILAPNPSPMTGPGTTTDLLGSGEVVVIDPGPADPRHLQAILAALAPGEQIVTILVTHPHLDHSALVPELVRATGAEVMGYGPAGSGRSAQMAALAAQGLAESAEGIDHAFRPDRELRHGDQLQLAGLQLEVLHTPGHMGEHLCFAQGRQLFCGDLVMAWAPSLVSPPDGDMAAYMASLAMVAGQGAWQRLLPSHGAEIMDAAGRLAELIAHRRMREAQVLAALATGPLTLEALVARIYHATDSRLWPAAARNVLAHLIELKSRGEISASHWPAKDSLYSLS